MMDRRRQAIWVVQVLKNVGGRMVSLCPIYGIRNEALDGHHAQFKASITS